MNFKEFFSLLKYILITRLPRHIDDMNTVINEFLKKCKSTQYTSLDVLDDLMNCELINLIKTNLDIFHTAVKNPNLWKEYYTSDTDASNWIRVHDFCMVIQIMKQFIQHPVVKILKLCNDILKSFLESF
ncbi:unnamed protein product [Heterobilharzia americana]|nr:unnamed protein product [Heterobilharzia americana]CAH8465358.1 unnamed protein product [Heterobilharzia americana]